MCRAAAMELSLLFATLLEFIFHHADARAGLSSKRLLDEQRLLSDLLENYDPKALPLGKETPISNYTSGTSQALITITLQLTKMEGIGSDLKRQTLSVSGWITTSWYDKRLTWDPAEYGNIDLTILPPENVWLPRFNLDNGASDHVYEEDYYRWFKVTAWSNGEIMWEPGGDFTGKCTVNVRYFPFDVQVCELIFANWVYTGALVNLTYGGEEYLLASFSKSDEWEIVKTKVWRRDFYWPGNIDPYPEVHYEFHLRRKPLYFIMNIIIPSIMLSILVLLVCLLPPDSGEKISMGVTLLLSFSVFILMISENVPATSNGVPIIVIYLLVSMAITCVTIGLSVFILCLHHKNEGLRPSKSMRNVAVSLAKVVCHKMKHIHPDEYGDNYSMKGSMRYKITIPSVCSDVKASATGFDTSLAQVNHTLLQILDKLSAHSRNAEQSEKNELFKQEWKEIATIIDKFFFWLLLFVLVIATSIILGIIPAIAPVPKLEV